MCSADANGIEFSNVLIGVMVEHNVDLSCAGLGLRQGQKRSCSAVHVAKTVGRVVTGWVFVASCFTVLRIDGFENFDFFVIHKAPPSAIAFM